MASNPLSASSLSSFIASSLPKDADPQLKTSTDAIAIACHAGMLAVGFRLIGLGEDDRISPSPNADVTNALPAAWNSHPSKDFRYAHSQSSMEYLLKIQRLGAKTTVQGIGMGDDKITSFDITTNDYISPSALPASPTTSTAASADAGAAADATSTANATATATATAIQTIYITPARLTDLGAQLRTHIIQRLLPSLHKEGYEESSASASASAAGAGSSSTSANRSTSSSTGTARPQPPPQNPSNPFTPHNPYNPLSPHPHPHPHPTPNLPTAPRPHPGPTPDFPPPDFEDEHGLLHPRHGPGPGPGSNPAGILPFNPRYGDADLYPAGLGPRDPLRPGFIGGGGGMHPRFGGGIGGGGDGMAGDGSGRVPFGARYDPVGPGDLGMGMGGGGGGEFGGGGFGGGGFGGPGGPGRPPGPPGSGGRFGGRPGNPFEGFGDGDFI